ncbi:MAG: ATP-binding protein [Sandaracinaceae bacterium]|nr:ATP-binding protein [Sandaracinaceae bacterium]
MLDDDESKGWSDQDDRTTVELVQTRTLPVGPTHREQLLLVIGVEPGRQFAINDEVTIGRGADCGVHLSDSSVSRTHARIARNSDGTLHIEDLRSRNGTFVNGEVVTSRQLTIGDRIQVGPRIVLLLTHEDPLKDLLRERQKMEAMGRLAAGVAHDFNNVSAAALAMCEELTAELQQRGMLGPGDLADCMRDLRVALERGADLVRSLATLGRRQSSDPTEVVDLATTCDDVARICERTFGPNIHVRRRWTAGLWLRAHPTELHQILLNLCLNARDAMSRGGTLRISAERGSGVRVVGHEHTEWILLRVADTGVGMDQKTLSRIFEPFFTTKAEGRGTGLGLATVRELVHGMRGRVEVESAPGQGSVFLVWLPAHA